MVDKDHTPLNYVHLIKKLEGYFPRSTPKYFHMENFEEREKGEEEMDFEDLHPNQFYLQE